MVALVTPSRCTNEVVEIRHVGEAMVLGSRLPVHEVVVRVQKRAELTPAEAGRMSMLMRASMRQYMPPTHKPTYKGRHQPKGGASAKPRSGSKWPAGHKRQLRREAIAAKRGQG